MPMPVELGQPTFNVPGLYQHYRTQEVKAAGQPDPRLSLDAPAGARPTPPPSAATVAKLAAFDRGEPILVPASIDITLFPEAAAVPFLRPAGVPDTPEEYDAQAWTVRVFSDDTVEVAETRGDMRDRAELVAAGVTRFRADAGCAPVPTLWDVQLGDWRDLERDANGEWEPFERRPFSSKGNGDWRTVALTERSELR